MWKNLKDQKWRTFHQKWGGGCICLLHFTKQIQSYSKEKSQFAEIKYGS